MYLNYFITKLNKSSLVEIVGSRFNQFFFGTVSEYDRERNALSILVGSVVKEVNPFLAETSVGVFEPAIQIRIDISVQ